MGYEKDEGDKESRSAIYEWQWEGTEFLFV